MANGVFAGIDAGSTTTKVALTDGRERLASGIAPTGANSRRSAEALLARALEHAGRARSDIRCLVSTGYGRRLIGFADSTVSEITADAWGAAILSNGSAAIRTVIDIGGQDSKVIRLDDRGILRDFIMNDKCAAGTGRFLEVMARAMEADLDRLGAMSLQAKRVLPVNSLCTVFAESEVVSLLAQGEAACDIVAGIHASIARRLAAMARKVGVREAVFFCGGPALNAGLRQALETELGVKLVVAPEPQLVVAAGAAAIAAAQADAADAELSRRSGQDQIT